ncbi:YiiG family protein [Sphingomonas fuzhouensis]|uniref:YiiG family protein n=1 Tax=Sphingomonas fuzhouensis TaxID=3106033 RepID=UPI002AFF529C|nr:YiiG family protein [Sphingomonas sp. SGZ-02]
MATDADQSEMQKYNAYVEAANTARTPFAEIAATYQRSIKPMFDSGKDLTKLFFPSDPGIDRIKAQLDKALAMKPAMPELDSAARTYSEALGTVAPLYRDMANYIEAKSYMSDKGAHGRELQPALIAALDKVAAAQATYAKAIDAKDRARIKAAFEATKKDTLDYYRKGTVYYLKESMDHASGVLDGKGLGDQKAAFKASLDQFNTMAVQFDNKVREKDKTACASFMLHANAYLAAGRDIIQRSEDGTYAKDRKNGSSFQMMKPKEVQDAETLLQTYNSVINDLNVSQC